MMKMKMKMTLLFLLLKITFFSMVACAETSKVTEKTKIQSEDICQQTWQKNDQEEFDTKHLVETCRLETKDGKHALQLVLYKDKCQRWDDSPERSCFFVRECGGEFATRRMSPPVYDKKSFIEGICQRDEDFKLLSSDVFSKSGDFSGAFISCSAQNKKSLSITLKVNQETKICKFPF